MADRVNYLRTLEEHLTRYCEAESRANQAAVLEEIMAFVEDDPEPLRDAVRAARRAHGCTAIAKTLA